MALSLKVDTADVPSIFKILGLGGDDGAPLARTSQGDTTALPADAAQPPPIDPSIEGPPADNRVPTKLGRLQQIISASQGDTAHPVMTDEHTSPAAPAQPRGLSDIMGLNGPDPATLAAMAQGHTPGEIPDASPIVNRPVNQLPNAGEGRPAVAVHKSFAEEHPTLARILKIGLGAAQGGAAGSGSMSFGEGFQRGQELPIQIAAGKLGIAEKKAQIAHTQATTDQMKNQVTLPNGLTVPFALAQRLYPTLLTEQGKNERGQKVLDSKESIADDKNTIALRKQGLKRDANGQPIPLTRDEMSETEQAATDLKQAQIAATKAHQTLMEFQSDPNNPKVQIAREMLKIHAQTAATAAGKLGLDKKRYLADYLGTDENGNPLPGVALTENGTPEGVKVTNATKPTNATRSKAEQAGVIKQQGEDLIKQIDAHPDLFGVVAGRWNDFDAGHFGNASPEVRDAYTSLKSFASLQPALHGSRGIGMQKEFEDALGTMKQNPEALKASVRSLLRTAASFQKAGTVRTSPGGGAHPAATHVYDPTTGAIVPVGK